MDALTAIKDKITRNYGLLALVIAACFIPVTLFLGYYSNRTIPLNPDLKARYTSEQTIPLRYMSNWDGPHYLHIAKHGYTDNALTAFFPLYPLLTRLVMFIASSPLYSALIISWACLAGAIYFYLKILAELVDKGLSERIMGVLLFILFPTGVFLVATYTESLTAFLFLGAFYFALKNRILASAVFSALATASHPDGIFVLPLVAVALWENKRRVKDIVLATFAGCGGIVAYIAYLWITKGQPLAFVHAQRKSNWLSSNYLHTFANSLTYLDVILFILAILAVRYWWERRKSLAIFSLLFVLLPLIGGNFAGYSRYSLLNFPVQMMLYMSFRRSRLAYPLIIAVTAISWAFFTIHYAAGYTGG